MEVDPVPWPHAPVHRLSECGTYFVTAATCGKAHLFRSPQRLAGWVNRLDATPGRKVWFNYWDTRLTFQRSYLARLNYVHQNAVHHELVQVPSQYPWCSARWLERIASPATVSSICRFRLDTVHVRDDFVVSADW